MLRSCSTTQGSRIRRRQRLRFRCVAFKLRSKQAGLKEFAMKDNLFPRLPRASKKHWAGFYPHPFIAAFHSLMLERGFSFSMDDKEGEHFYWKRLLFTGYEASVWISPKNTKKNRSEAFGLFVNLCVESSRQAFVDSMVRPWECINLREGNRLGPDGEKTLVFMGFLDWLAERW